MKQNFICITIFVCLTLLSSSWIKSTFGYTIDTPLVMSADARAERIGLTPGCSVSNLAACNPFSTCLTWYGAGGPSNSFANYPDGTPVSLPAVISTASSSPGWGYAYYQNWPTTSSSTDISGLVWQGYQAGTIYNNVPFLLGKFTHKNWPIDIYDPNNPTVLQTRPCNLIKLDITFQLTDSSSGTPYVVPQKTTVLLQVEETPNTGCDPAYSAVPPSPYTNPWAGFGRGSCPHGCDPSTCGSTDNCQIHQTPIDTDYICNDPRSGYNIPYGVDCGSGCFDRITILDSGITSSSIFPNPNTNKLYFLGLLGFVKKVGDTPIYTFDTAETSDNSASLYAQVVQTCLSDSDCDDGVACTIATCVPKTSPLNTNNYPASFCTYALSDPICDPIVDQYGCADGTCTKTGCTYQTFNSRCNAYGPCISATCAAVSGAASPTYNCFYGTPDNSKCNYLTSQIPGCIPICNTTGYCGCQATTTTTTTTRTTTTTPTTTTTTRTTTPTTTRTTTTRTTTTTTSTTTTPPCIQSLTYNFNFSTFKVSPNSGTNLIIVPPTDLFVGYSIALLSTSTQDETIRLFGGSLTYPIFCSTTSRPLTVNIPNRDIVIPAGSTSSDWFPSADPSDLSTYTGAWYQADRCSGANMTIRNNGQFTFTIQAWRLSPETSIPFQIMFHWTYLSYPNGCCDVGTPFSTALNAVANQCNRPTTTTTRPTTTSTTSTTRSTTTTTTGPTTPTTTRTTTPTTTRTTTPTTTTTTTPTTTTTTTTACATPCKLCRAPLDLYLIDEPSCDSSCGAPYGYKLICVYDASQADWSHPARQVPNDLVYTYFLTYEQQKWNFFAQSVQNHIDPSENNAKFDCDCHVIPPTTTTTTPPPPPQIKPMVNCLTCGNQQCWALIGYDATSQTPDVPGGFTVSRSILPTNNYMTIQYPSSTATLAGVLGDYGQPTSFSIIAPVSGAATITFPRFATIVWYIDGNSVTLKQGGAVPCSNCDFPGQIAVEAIDTADVVGVTYEINFNPLTAFCGSSTSRAAVNYTLTPRYFVADIPSCATMFKPIVTPSVCTPLYSPVALWVPYPSWDPYVVNPDCFWSQLSSPYVVPLLPQSPDGTVDCRKVSITIQLPKESCPQVTLGVDDIGGLFDSTCKGCDTCRTIGMLGITSKCPTPDFCTALPDGTPTSWNSATCKCEPCLLSCPPYWTPSPISCKCRPCDPDLCTPGVNWNIPSDCGRCIDCPANPEQNCAWNQRVYKTLDPPEFFANPSTGCPECGPCNECPPDQTYIGDDCTCGPCSNCLPGCSCSCPDCPIGYELDLENIDPANDICPCIPCDITCGPGQRPVDAGNLCLGCISCPVPECADGSQYGIEVSPDLCGCQPCPLIECATGFRLDPVTGCGCVECNEQCDVGTVISDDRCSCVPVNVTEPPTTPGPCPNGVIDICGVCNGDGTACLGCDGKPGTGRWYDPCNIPCGDGSTCNYCKNDECSVCTTVVDICGVCGGNGSSCLGCDGLPPTLTRPPTEYDWCGVCGGNGTSCLGCDGKPFSGPCPAGITPGAAAAVASLSALAAISAVSVALILLRFRKRPELLYQAWDDTLKEYITEIESNPLYVQNEQESNPLWENR